MIVETDMAPTSPLPDFAHPPVVEVALSLQYEPLEELRTPQIGLLWSTFRKRFPKIEEHAPLEPVFERFGITALPGTEPRIRLQQRPPTPRCWFLNKDGTELIQVQQDRFIHNWRKDKEGGEYPRYESVRRTFERELGKFREFLKNETLGELQPNQCEITYVNHIFDDSILDGHAHLERILSLFSPKYTEEFLPEPEDIRLGVRYIIPNDETQPLGRLHVNVEPAFLGEERKPIFILTLTARGGVEPANMDGVFDFLNRGHEWIVRGFASITTPEMHDSWGRRDGR